jgi:hypothetical protein
MRSICLFLPPNGKRFTGAELNRLKRLSGLLSLNELYTFFFGGFAREARLAARFLPPVEPSGASACWAGF